MGRFQKWLALAKGDRSPLQAQSRRRTKIQCPKAPRSTSVARKRRGEFVATKPADGAATKPADGGLRGDKTACLRAVKRQINNPKLVVLSVETSEANNSVTIGVAPNRAPWRCLVKREIVADVTSLTDEGKL